jgi:parallel beta-helix repeat protein
MRARPIPLLVVAVVMSLIASLASLTGPSSNAQAASSSDGIPVKIVFNVALKTKEAYLNEGPAGDGYFDPGKGFSVLLDRTKGFQSFEFNIADLKNQLGGSAKVESIGFITDTHPQFDPDSYQITNGWPDNIDTLWVGGMSAGNQPILNNGTVRDFVFKNFVAPMDNDWNELTDSPLYPYMTYGINGVIGTREESNNMRVVKYDINGAAGASWMVYKQPIDISGMNGSDKFRISLDIGYNEYPNWSPKPVSKMKRNTPPPTYEIGPGKRYATIGDMPWESLKAGEVVYLYWRETPYKEKIAILAQGTDDKPIVIHGVPGPHGELPQIDGSFATTRPTMGFTNDARGLVEIGSSDRLAKYITLENLEIFNAHASQKYIDPRTGQQKPYKKNASGIWVDHSENITIRNCIVHNNGNGIFVSSWNGIDYWGAKPLMDSFTDYASKHILFERNSIYANGNAGSMFEHNTYSAAIDTVYQFNHYGPLIDRSRGYGLKDRGAGTVIRYNWIEGGRRQISLDDGEDSPHIVFDPNYNDSFVYGNVLVEPDHLFDSWGDDEIVHFGGDNSAVPDRHGTLYLYNNTITTYRQNRTYGSDAFAPGRTERTVLLYLPGNQTAEVRNNVFYAGGADPAPISIVNESGTVNLSHNWLSSNWKVSYDDPNRAINDDGTNLSGSDPGFVDSSLAGNDYRLTPNSPLIDAAGPFADKVLRLRDINLEYVKHQSYEERDIEGKDIDIGAYEWNPDGEKNRDRNEDQSKR